jgi:hypothetical protein
MFLPLKDWSARWAIPLLILISLLVLGRVCFAHFLVWDDNFNVRLNPAFLPPTAASIWHLWTSPSFFLYIPVTYTVWGAISWATQSADAAGHITQAPWAFHSANLAVHLIAVSIVFRTLRLLDLSIFGCFCGALLFAIHPLQVETVAWVSGFRDLLAGALCLAAARQYLLYARESDVRAGRMHYLWATLAFLCATLSKSTACTLPLWIAALDRLAVGRPWRKILPPAAAWLLIAVPVALIARSLQDARSPIHIPIWQRPFIAGDSIAFYLAKLVWPVHLSVDYGRTPTAVLASGQCYWDWIIPAVIAIALILGRRRRPLLLLAGVSFLVGLLPVLGLTAFLFQYLSTTADHYLYLSMFGPAVALAWLVSVSSNRMLHSITLVALLACCLLTFHRAGYWKDDRTLWPRVIAENPRSFAAYTNLGIAYTDNEDYVNAIDCFARAVALRPQEDIAHNDLANALHQAGRLSEAIVAKQRTLDIERADPTMEGNWTRHTAEMGAFLCEAGRYSEAVPYLEAAHSIAPNDPKVSFLLRRATTRGTSKN